MYEKSIGETFSKLNQEVIPFKIHPYFKIQSQSLIIKNLELVYKKAQNKYLFGPIVNKLNHDLINAVKQNLPDTLFVFRGTHVKGETLKYLKNLYPQMTIVIYNHDDPFSPDYPFWKPWRHFIDSIPNSDLVLAHRHRNFPEYFKKGARRVELLRTWFIPERNHPINFSMEDKEKYECDVVFAGHYESDGRLTYLEEIAKHDFNLKIFGGNNEWAPALENSTGLKHLLPTKHAWGEEYNKALAGGKIALCFLSKLNRDTYATRCFEIPATGTFLLSEYTDDLASLFTEGENIEFFRSKEEMIQKLKKYSNDDVLRRKVAAAGHSWVITQGHDVVSRMRQVLTWIESTKQGSIH